MPALPLGNPTLSFYIPLSDCGLYYCFPLSAPTSTPSLSDFALPCPFRKDLFLPQFCFGRFFDRSACSNAFDRSTIDYTYSLPKWRSKHPKSDAFFCNRSMVSFCSITLSVKRLICICCPSTLEANFLLYSVSCTHLIVRFFTTSFNFSISGSAFLSR